MKHSATLFSWFNPGIIRCSKSNVKVFLALFFVFSGLFFNANKAVAQCNSFNIDFKQAANKDGGYEPGQIHWIGSILQNSNSRYIEGMSTLQRVVMNNLPSCGLGYHKLRIKMETRKGDNHAYDFLTSWDNAFLAAAAIAPGFDIFPASRTDAVNDLNECGDEIGACSGTACTLVTGGTGFFRDLPIIDGETNNVIQGPPADQNTVSQIIPVYETRYGNRTVRVYVGPAGFGGTAADNQVVFVGYGDANPNDGGDTYIYYDIMWVSTSPDVVIEYGAHIAVGVDGLAPGGSDLGVGYLLNRGASAINGGPYHCIIEDFQNTTNNTPKCEPNLGNLDNQLQGSEVLLIPSCDLQGPSAVCANSTATYTASVTNPENATYLWSIINSSQAAPAATINGTASGNVPAPISPATTTPLSITVNTGGVGTYTVKLTITNGGQTTNTTDDDIISSCTVTTTVSGAPTISCPTSTATAACQTQAQVDLAYQNWLATASAGATNNGGTSGPDKCGGAKTVIFTVTNSCGTATCSATFTVTADNTPPGFTGNYSNVPLACNPASSDISGALGSASATDNCSTTTVTSSDGAVGSDGCLRSQTRTFTARDACGNTATTSRSVTWTADVTPPTFTGSYSNVPLGCNPAASDISGALGSASATDACATPTISSSDGAVGSTGCTRSQTRTFTARDGCGNTSTISRTVTWTADLTPPTFTGSYANVPLGCNPAASDITGALGTATATDACSTPTITSSDGGVSTDGCSRSQTRTFTARDACGNTATTSRTVTWTADVTPPTFTSATTPIDLGCVTGQDVFGAIGGATATDACSIPTITFTDGAIQSSGCARTATRTFTARDACGNTATTSRSVTFINDPTPPTFTGSYATVPLGCNPAASDITGALDGATATDACSTPTITQSDGGVTSDGCSRSQTRTFTARDACGNTATISRTVTWTADVTPPTFTGSYANVPLGCNPAATDITGALDGATATDACSNPTITQSDGSVQSTGCARSQTRTFTARDACGNTATVSRTVTWTADNTPPTFTGSYANVPLGCNPAASDITGALGSASATDACAPPTITQSDGGVSSDGCARSQTRTFTARDGCGNTATVSRTVTWTADVTPPTFTGSYANVPLGCNPAASDINAALDGATATDVCSTPTITQSDGSVQSTGCARSQTRTFTARDACGNTATVSRTVTWTADVTPPVITTGGTTTTLGCNPSAGDINLALGSASASDACGAPTLSVSDGAVQSSGCGRSQTRSWTARDACGNTSTAARTVTWTADLTPPTITCAASYTAACGTAPVFTAPSATDACGTPTVTQLGDDVVQGSCPTTYTRTWRATDACGNTSTCSQTVTVPCCSSNCTYTQGYYGNNVGSSCDGTTSSNNPYTTTGLIAHSLANWGGTLTVGCLGGRSVTINNTDADIACVIDVLPGMQGSGPLTINGDFNICSLPSAYLSNQHRINNQLLSQTITLGLNLGINPPSLGNFALQANKYLVTADLVECGSTTVKECRFNCTPDPINIGQYIWTVAYTPYHVSDCKFSQALYDALTTKNVSGLYALANSALCGNALPAGVSYGDITNALDCINNAFDGCRSFTGWFTDKPTPQSFCTLPSATTPCPAPVTRISTQPIGEVSADQLTVNAYPNPFTDRVRFVIRSKVSGQGSLEIYNMLGQKIETVYNGTIVAERSQIVEYKTSTKLNGGLIYIFRVGSKQATGKLLKIEQ